MRLALPASAAGQAAPAPGSTPAAKAGSSATTTPPPAREAAPNLTEARAIRIARTDPKVAEQRRRYGPLSASAQAKPGTWQVDFYASGTERVQVIVDDATGKVRESWTGYQIAWQMARGYPEQFGHKLNAPYVWLPLAAIFLLGLVDWRRKWRVVHLDLLVLLSFGLSAIFFNAGNIGVSVPLAYPPLVYLLARMLWVGFRGAGEGLRPSAPTAWLAIGGAFLLGFRIALNIADSGVIDVGYAGVIGADRIAHGQAVWGLNAFPSDNSFGDTYGPFNYFAYIPFELALPWHGAWDDLAAAHAAAIVFDLATVGGLLVLGTPARRDPPRRHPRLRLGRLSVHRLRAAVELQRHPGRGAPRLGAGRLRLPDQARRAARPGDARQVRAAGARALVRHRRARARRPWRRPAPRGARRRRGSARSRCSRSPSSAASP